MLNNFRKAVLSIGNIFISQNLKQMRLKFKIAAFALK